MTLRLLTAALAACVVMCVSPQAYAQYDAQALREASIEIYNTCITEANSSDAGCACAVGYIGGALSTREFEIMGRLARIGSLTVNGGSEAAIQAEIQILFNDGYTVAEVQAVTDKLQTIVQKGDMICAPFEQQNTM